MRHRRLYARLGIAVSAAGLLLGLSAPFAAGLSSSSASNGNCSPSTVITAFHFTVNGVTATTLHRGTVHSGDKLEAFFTIAEGCTNVPVTLVSHTMPTATFVPTKVTQQKVFDVATGTFDGGSHTLGPINVPSCFFQVDFVYGGIHGSGYEVHDHTYSSGTGGTTSCSTAPAPAISNCTSATGVGITFSPATTGSTTFAVAVTVNGKTTTDSVSVSKSAVTKTYAVPEDAIATILVKDTSGVAVLNQTVTHDCARPAVTVVDQCSLSGSPSGAAVTATNEGSQTKTFTVSKNGVVVDHINVAPYATMTVVEAETEGQTATWLVSGPEGVFSGPLTMAHICTSVLPVVITAPAAPAKTPAAPQVLSQHAGPLAVTGSDTGLLLWLSFALMVGGALVTLSSRRLARSS